MNISDLTIEDHCRDREPQPSVLVVDDETHARQFAESILASISDFDSSKVLYASNLQDAFDVLSKTKVHVVLLDKNFGDDENDPLQNGIKAIPVMLQIQPHLQILMLTGSKNVEDTVSALREGAYDYVTKDENFELISAKVARAIDVSRAAYRRARQERALSTVATRMGGNSEAFQEVMRMARLLAESSRPVLLLGESGTGKSETAREIHEARGRFLKQESRNYYQVNIATLGNELADRELFGNERGAYTDAREARPGLFELANDGTLFLDEIGEASLDLQAKLLTVVETGEFRRLGGTRIMKSHPKLIFATNRDLAEMVKRKEFREDLYMRICAFPILMPPLRDRVEDIPEIIRYLLPKSASNNNVKVKFEDIPSDFLAYLKKNPPAQGNVRGIQQQLERLLVFCPKDRDGNPMLAKWKQVPGLYSPTANQVSASKPVSEAPKAITLKMIRTLPFEVIGPEFVGLDPLLDEITEKIVRECIQKFTSGKKISSALKVSPATVSRILRKIESIPERGRPGLRVDRQTAKLAGEEGELA